MEFTFPPYRTGGTRESEGWWRFAPTSDFDRFRSKTCSLKRPCNTDRPPPDFRTYHRHCGIMMHCFFYYEVRSKKAQTDVCTLAHSGFFKNFLYQGGVKSTVSWVFSKRSGNCIVVPNFCLLS